MDIIQMLRDLTNEMTPEAFMYEQSLSLDIPEKLPTVMADEGRLRQVLMNLINNACKFSSSKGSVTVSAEQCTGEIILSVRDTGPGISEEDQKRLFEAYHRLESDREHLSGLGLGLSLAKTIVELHKGRIWVTSEKGKGSAFAFTIPITPITEKKGEPSES
jgi:signal transduction histidine kinase